MKKVLLIIVAMAMGCNSSQKTVTEQDAEPTKPKIGPVTYAESITEAELKEHLYTYSSDEFEGRETGKPGQKKAIAYLKAEYEKMEIPAAKSDGDYFQNVPLEVKNLPTGSMTVNGTEFPIGENMLTFSNATGDIEELIYVGYGIEEGDYSDYKDVDVKDKWILVKAGEPQNEDGTYLFSGSEEKVRLEQYVRSPRKTNGVGRRKRS